MIIIRILKRTEKLTEDESDILDMIKHYSKLYCRVLRDPSDKDAARMMRIYEDDIVMDPDVERLVGDPLEFLYKLDKQIEDAYERRLKKCRR